MKKGRCYVRQQISNERQKSESKLRIKDLGSIPMPPTKYQVAISI